MATTFRMSEELEALLAAAADVSGKRRSEIIREALRDHCRKLLDQQQHSWYDQLVASGFKPARLGLSDLSTNRKHLKRLMHERADRRTR